MAELPTFNKIKDSYIAYINAHYVSDEDARRIKDEFDRLRAENAKLKELASGYESLAATLCDERGCDGCPFDSELPVCEHMRLVSCLGELGADE